jgi:AcrR family transcriptional regulator
VYFGDKEQLFDTVVTQHLEAMLDAVPFTAEDLPGYAVLLFDYLQDRPGMQRLFGWRNLERTETSGVEQASYRDKIAQISEAQRNGSLDATLPARHLLAFLLGIVQGWAIASSALTAADHSGDHLRESVYVAAARLVSAPG